ERRPRSRISPSLGRYALPADANLCTCRKGGRRAGTAGERPRVEPYDARAPNPPTSYPIPHTIHRVVGTGHREPKSAERIRMKIFAGPLLGLVGLVALILLMFFSPWIMAAFRNTFVPRTIATRPTCR